VYLKFGFSTYELHTFNATRQLHRIDPGLEQRRSTSIQLSIKRFRRPPGTLGERWSLYGPKIDVTVRRDGKKPSSNCLSSWFVLCEAIQPQISVWNGSETSQSLFIVRY
jgi:hypothetical protein